jgi:hypothetical protein
MKEDKTKMQTNEEPSKRSGETIEELWQNYDKSFKYSFLRYKDKIFEMFGLSDIERKQELAAMLILASNKVVDKVILNSAWEEIWAMRIKVLEIAEDKGIEKGIEIGKIDTAKEMLAEGDSIEKISRVTKITVSILEKHLFPEKAAV